MTLSCIGTPIYTGSARPSSLIALMYTRPSVSHRHRRDRHHPRRISSVSKRWHSTHGVKARAAMHELDRLLQRTIGEARAYLLHVERRRLASTFVWHGKLQSYFDALVATRHQSFKRRNAIPTDRVLASSDRRLREVLTVLVGARTAFDEDYFRESGRWRCDGHLQIACSADESSIGNTIRSAHEGGGQRASPDRRRRDHRYELDGRRSGHLCSQTTKPSLREGATTPT